MRARDVLVLSLGFALLVAGVAVYVTSTATGALAIRIHDSPAAWSHLTVTFSRVAVRAGDASTWIVLSLAEAQIDFLAPGNLTWLLALDHVAPQAYSQLQLVVSSVDGVLSGGAPVSLAVTDGVVVTTAPFAVHGGGTTTVTLDLDLAHSIQLAGSSWTFQPVLGAVSVA